MAGDAESARAAAWQQRVLARVGEAIDKQVQAADEALRDAEDELVQTLGAQPQSDAYARWQQARAQRDAALASVRETADALRERERELGDLKREHQIRMDQAHAHPLPFLVTRPLAPRYTDRVRPPV